MFEIFESLAKTVVSVVKLPVAVVADVITMGGALTEKDKPYTAETCEQIMDNLDNAAKPK